jgi:glycosyltransferase involved in cell wall biosynthesis
MSVIVICEGLAAGGAVANVAWQQALGLSHHQPVCLISDGLSPERRQQLETAGSSLRVELLPVPRIRALHRFAHLPRQLLWIHKALRALGRELSGRESTVVLCHSHPLAASVIWRFGRRVRLVMISHGDASLRPPGTYDPTIHWLYRRCTGPAHQHAAISVALSPAMARRIRACGVDDRRISLIPNGLDPAEIGLMTDPATPESHWWTRPLRLLFVGRLDPVKGVDVLLEAMRLAQRQGTALQLDLVAAATDKQARDLRQTIASLGLEPLIRWHGPCQRSALAAHYLHCHVVVVPSRDDPLPTVVLEAMACGRPVVASDVGGISYQLLEGACGVLVPPRNPHALAAAMLRLDRDRRLITALGQRALQRSRQFSWDDNVRALQALVESQWD